MFCHGLLNNCKKRLAETTGEIIHTIGDLVLRISLEFSEKFPEKF